MGHLQPLHGYGHRCTVSTGTHRCAPVSKVPRRQSAGPVAVCCRVWLVHFCCPVVVHSTRGRVAFSASQLEEHDRAHRPITPFGRVLTRDCRLGDICSLKRAVVQHLSPSCARTTLNSVKSSSASKCLRGVGNVAIQPHMGLVTEPSFVAGQSSALLVRFHLRVVVRLEAGTSWLCRSVMVAVHPQKKKSQCIPSPAISTPSTPNRPPTLSTP